MKNKPLKVVVHWRCPYCGHANRNMYPPATQSVQYEFAHCDNEDGGCDQRVVLDITTVFYASPRRIEGYGNNTKPAHDAPPDFKEEEGA